MDRNQPTHPSSRSLAVWLTLSVGAFVLVGSLALLLLVQRQVRHEEASSFEALARANVSFLDRTPLPLSSQMATQLGEIMGAEVFFHKGDKLISARGTIREVESLRSANGKAVFNKDALTVVNTLRNGTEVTFVRRADLASLESVFARTDTWLALGVFWSLALALGAWLARRLTHPLTQLAAAAPAIGGEAALPPLPTSRHDEIGQLARAISETHRSLQSERERRRAAERLALLGRMATSLAHEVRNPVSAIRLHAQLLEGASPDEAAASRELIESEAARIESLVRQWMLFARPAPPVMKEINLSDLIEQRVRLLQPQALHANVTIVNEATINRRLVGDAERLGQVLHNLLINAIQAMARGGALTLRSAAKTELVIEDEGPGFSAAALAHATEAFFSEKEGGMGLGLAVASEICIAHGAQLTIANRVEGGGRVSIAFQDSSAAGHL